MFASLPNRLTITGHTDSSGGAQAWNRKLGSYPQGEQTQPVGPSDAGLPPEQVAQLWVWETALRFRRPFSSINRRIAIIVLNKRTDKAIASRAGGANAEGEVTDDADRETTINRSGSLLDKLQKQREDADNQYDNPPDPEEEAFW